MITNVSDIINNIFEKIFENPEISFSHPNRTFQYAVRHGKLNEDYLALNEDTLERKLKTGIAQAIVKEFPACDPDVRVTVFYDDPHEKRVYNVKCSIAIYYSFTERADNIDGKTVVLSEEDGKKLLEEMLKRMEDQLGTEIEVAWGYETYCGAKWIDTGIVIAGEELVNDPENPINPLHTALAVYGCLLGYNLIADEMNDKELTGLIRHIGYDEGMKVVTDPGILSPKAFIDEVIEKRLPNPFMPDTPQRIATDTSQKIVVRFGETMKSYMASSELDCSSLVYIPLAIAGWLRYLLGADDKLEKMELSSDPMLAKLQEKLSGVEAGKPETYTGQLKEILTNKAIFGVDMYEAGLADKVEGMFVEMLAGKDAVRNTLKKYVD